MVCVYYYFVMKASIVHHKISVQKTAHCFTLGEANEQTKQFWLVCHGYGQLASTFIKDFEVISNSDTFILAPEGFSRFYWNKFTGPVVASWMTRQDRLDEIDDYSHFLSALLEQFLPVLPRDVQINLLGFSQGTATICRWMMKTFPHFDNLLLWGGLLPEDIDYRSHTEYLHGRSITFVYGKEDLFLPSERVIAHAAFAKEQGIDLRTVTFEGKHEIPGSVLRELAMKFS